MHTDRHYDGYRAFDYLDDDDYERFDVHEGPNFGEPYEVPLTEDEERQVAEVVSDHPVVSLHDHPIYLPQNMDQYDEYGESGWVQTAYEELAQSPLDAVFVSNLGARTWDSAVNALGKCYADAAKSDFVVRAGSVEDVRRAKAEGKVAFVPAIETSMPIENELDRLDVLYGLGIRSLGITYSDSNALGTGLGEDFQGGLTKFGERAVERMNKLGVLADVSHASDQTALDTCEVSEKPVVASHNGAQELLDITRLDPDGVLEAVAETGGVVGIQSAPHTTATENHPRHDIEGVMEHFEYVKDLVGIDHVTFGPDTMYGDHYALHQHFGKDMSQFPDWLDTGIDYSRGVDNPTEAWNNVVRWLVKHDYAEEDIAKVVGGNTLRVLEAVW
ncbi:MAG: dipeptidase [Haloglomus sp.]